MPKVAYSEESRENIRNALVAVGLELMAKQGIQHTTVEQIYKRVGISRTFFYSFFPTKEDLVVETLYLQQPKIIAYVKKLMSDPALSWRESYKVFREKQTRLFGEILKNFGVRADKGNINLFTNLSLMVMIVRRAIPDTLPLLVPEAVEETVDFQINAIVDALEKRREVKNVKEAGGREQKKSVGKVKTKGEEERESKSKNGK